MKYTVVMIGLALIVMGVGSFLLSAYVEQALMETIEDSLSATFAAQTTVRSLSISPVNRSLELRGVEVANPPGFDRDVSALRCEKIVLKFNPKTLLTDSPVIRQAHFEQMDVYYRHKIGKGTNIKRLSERAALSASTSGPDSYPKISVEQVHCRNARIHFSSNIIPGGSVGVDVVDVHVTDLQRTGANNSRVAAAIFFRSLVKEIATLNGALGPQETAHPLSRDQSQAPSAPEASMMERAREEFGGFVDEISDGLDEFAEGAPVP